MKHLQLYMAIKAIVDEGSFRKASELLGISPSSLLRQVKGLEEELDAPLFDRFSGGVRLTTVGEIYYRTFNEHLAQMDRAKETVSDLRGVRIGHVRIAVSPELAPHYLFSQVQTFRQTHPRVTFSIIPTPSVSFSEALMEGQADLALILLPVMRSGIETLASRDVSLSVVVPTGSQTVLYPHDLEDHQMIVPTHVSGVREMLDVHFGKRQILLDQAIETDHLLPPHLLPRPSLQFWPAVALDVDALQRLGGQVGVLTGLPRVRLSLCQLGGRVLPVAAARFGMQLQELLHE